MARSDDSHRGPPPIALPDDDLTMERSLVLDDGDDDEVLALEIGTIEWRPPGARNLVSEAEIKERIDHNLGDTGDDGTERVSALLSHGIAESRAGNQDTAVVALDMAITEAAGSAPAEAAVASCAPTITRIFDTYLDRVRGASTCALPVADLATMDLDPESVFLLSRADGMLTVDDIIDVSGMPRLEAIRHLCRLLMNGLLLARPA
ncbi:MAG TPA: hypothetical protein VFG83_15205 [Kofleriaceae bacterium]|nr:hypothetical protein [Kofleriaceae bacterium]